MKRLLADVLAAARQALTEIPEGHLAVVGRETLRLRYFHGVA